MFFDSWNDVLRVLVIGVLAYLVLVAGLRVSGKRTLSKWNAFDFIVTIALGSTLATVILSESTALAEGLIALGVLIALQFVMTWLTVHTRWLEPMLKARPTVLLRDGQLVSDAMQSQRVTESEILAAIRGAGFAALEDIAAVVLETDGSFSVLQRREGGSMSALADVPGYPFERGDPPERPQRASG